MTTITIILVLVLAVVLSGAIARMSPLNIPLPLIQILLGIFITSVVDLGIELRPETFFLLFLPPLLFLDGWRIPKEGLFRDKWTILALAFGLVIFTVVGLGYFVHWMIPAMPLAVAFALAAIVSPTDTVAVSAIAARVPIPKRLMHVLEGESLLNDASGLVCMSFAVAAAMTGAFSLAEASGTFVWLAIGGFAIGIGVTLAIAGAKNWISGHFGEDSGSQILISVLTPFAAYLLAEYLDCSSALAAVSAGITMSYVEQTGRALAMTRVGRTAVWNTIQFTLNGTIFVLLGEQLPQIIDRAAQVLREAGEHDLLWLLVYVVAITLALAVLRFVWVWATLHLTEFGHGRDGQEPMAKDWRLIATASLAGVKGAMTLAGILSLPLILPDGSGFPARDLAIFLAAGVIIFSLVSAALGLPLLLRSVKPPAKTPVLEEDHIRIAAAEAAISALEAAKQEREGVEEAPHYFEAAENIIEVYRKHIEMRSKTGEDALASHRLIEIEHELRLVALRAERDEIFHHARIGKASDDLARKLVMEIDLLEARTAQSRARRD